MLRKIEEYVILFVIMGTVYGIMEFVWRICLPSSEDPWSQQTIVMMIIGGLVGVCVGYLNENNKIKKWSMQLQVLVSTLIIMAIELVTGLVANVLLVNLGVIDRPIWYYNHFHIFHQVCLTHSLLWLLIAPFAIWLDDHLRHKIFNEEESISLLESYKSLFKFKKA